MRDLGGALLTGSLGRNPMQAGTPCKPEPRARYHLGRCHLQRARPSHINHESRKRPHKHVDSTNLSAAVPSSQVTPAEQHTWPVTEH